MWSTFLAFPWKKCEKLKNPSALSQDFSLGPPKYTAGLLSNKPQHPALLM